MIRKFNRKQKDTESEHGIALVMSLVSLGGLILLMIMVVQLIEVRSTAARNLYLTYQTAQQGQVNVPYSDDSMSSALWVPILEGYSGLTKVADGTLTTTQNFDADGDGSSDGSFTISYTNVAGGQDTVTAFYQLTDSFLSNAFTFLYPIQTNSAIDATLSDTGFSIHVDSTSRILGTSLSLSNLYSYFNIAEDGSGDPTPIEDRAKLPNYLTGKMLYTPRAGAWTKNCAANAGEMALFSNKLALDIEAYAGPPGNVNGWCSNPWVLQKQELQSRFTDYSLSYRKAIQILLQYLSQNENRVRLSVFSSPTSGGAILENDAGGNFTGGDFELYNSTSNMYSTTLNNLSMQTKTVVSAVGGCGGSATFNSNVSWQPGPRIIAAMRGLIGDPYDEIYVNNYENSGSGHDYLGPLPNPLVPGFPYASCSPYDFNGASHPIHAGILPSNGTWGVSGLRLPLSGNITVGATTYSWPTYYAVDSDGNPTASVYANPSVNNYAPCMFNDISPNGTRRDLRSVFQNALTACQAHKSASGATAPCATIVFAHGLPELSTSAAVPNCTTATTLTFAQHMSEISTDLAAFDALDNTYTILVFLNDGTNNATNMATFLAAFDTDTYPDRFLINYTTPSPDSSFESQFLEVIKGIISVIKERAIMQKL